MSCFLLLKIALLRASLSRQLRSRCVGGHGAKKMKTATTLLRQLMRWIYAKSNRYHCEAFWPILTGLIQDRVSGRSDGPSSLRIDSNQFQGDVSPSSGGNKINAKPLSSRRFVYILLKFLCFSQILGKIKPLLKLWTVDVRVLFFPRSGHLKFTPPRPPKSSKSFD